MCTWQAAHGKQPNTSGKTASKRSKGSGSKGISVPIVAVFLYRSLQYFCTDRCAQYFCTDRCSISVPIAAVFLPRLELSLLQIRNSLLYRSLQYFCTDRCSISATSGLSLLQIRNSLLYRSLQYFSTPLDRYPRSLHTTVDSQPICD